MIEEKGIRLDVDVGKVSKKMSVFYNPVMELNRTVSIEVLRRAFSEKARIALPLAGSGVRGLRFLAECPEKIGLLAMNDHSPGFAEAVKERLALNKLEGPVEFSEEDANVFLLSSEGFDYIDVDPFGTPNPFLDSAVQRIARNGLLAVTATDTSALAGTYLGPCRRKYWAEPLRNWLKHYVGLCILIRKVQLIGAQYEKALHPVFSYSKDHYYRVFFRCQKGKKKCDEILSLHKYLIYDKSNLSYRFSSSNTCSSNETFVGPIFSGKLWSNDFLDINDINWISDEASIDGYYIDIHVLCKKLGITVPAYSKIKSSLVELGHSYARSHFGYGMIKTNAPIEVLEKIVMG